MKMKIEFFLKDIFFITPPNSYTLLLPTHQCILQVFKPSVKNGPRNLCQVFKRTTTRYQRCYTRGSESDTHDSSGTNEEFSETNNSNVQDNKTSISQTQDFNKTNDSFRK